MKPRIRLMRGVWHCFTPSVPDLAGTMPMGRGDSPLEAFLHWRVLTTQARISGGYWPSLKWMKTL